MNYIENNWKEVSAEIMACGRRDVSVVAVTKMHEVGEIEALLTAGARLVGENRVEEIERKYGDGRLRSLYPGLEMHLIGHLQSRKAKLAVRLCDCIDSLDSLELAGKLSGICQETGRTVRVMLEVNVSGEKQKYGLSPAETGDVAAKVADLAGLELYGLMCMAPNTEDRELIREVFRGLGKLAAEIAAAGTVRTPLSLSMGMSNDYKIALDEGSNYLRIGSRLFMKEEF